jgi:peptidoglycan hydrolase-like protein with peptidoglycan-binding domain
MRHKSKKFTALAVAVLILAMASSAWASLPILKQGSSGPQVSQVQQILKNKGYFTYPTITGYFGPITTDAVATFQRSKGLVDDGIVGPNTYAKLGIKEETPSDRGSGERVLNLTRYLRYGMTGDDVATMQSLLNAKGYGLSVDGIFGYGTLAAVKAFQSASGLYADGIVGPATAAKLNASAAIELIDWANIDAVFPRYVTATVTDVDTGITFNIYRMGGHNHADVEPLTATDTAKMLQCYGGAWSWARRAIVVTVNGHRIAASMNGMPHGQQTIYNNNFDGQFCIHFLNSRTHASNSVDAAHQAMVHKAYNSQWQ